MLLMTSNYIFRTYFSIQILIVCIRLVADVGSVFRDIDVDHEIRSVVLSGNGRMFTAGLDCNYHTCKII